MSFNLFLLRSYFQQSIQTKYWQYVIVVVVSILCCYFPSITIPVPVYWIPRDLYATIENLLIASKEMDVGKLLSIYSPSYQENISPKEIATQLENLSEVWDYDQWRIERVNVYLNQKWRIYIILTNSEGIEFDIYFYFYKAKQRWLLNTYVFGDIFMTRSVDKHREFMEDHSTKQ